MANIKLETGYGAKELMLDMGDGTVARQIAPGRAFYTLYSAGAPFTVGPCLGGDYVWRAESSAWNGATAALQSLGLDGVTWSPVRNIGNTADITLSANGFVPVVVVQGAVIRVALSSGTPTALNSVMGGV